MPSSEEINSALEMLKQALVDERVRLWPREKNMNTLAELGIMWKDVCEELANLTISDYAGGPDTDISRPSEDKAWVFVSWLFQKKMYVKFVVEHSKEGSILCLSFHPSK